MSTAASEGGVYLAMSGRGKERVPGPISDQLTAPPLLGGTALKSMGGLPAKTVAEAGMSRKASPGPPSGVPPSGVRTSGGRISMCALACAPEPSSALTVAEVGTRTVAGGVKTADVSVCEVNPPGPSSSQTIWPALGGVLAVKTTGALPASMLTFSGEMEIWSELPSPKMQPARATITPARNPREAVDLSII